MAIPGLQIEDAFQRALKAYTELLTAKERTKIEMPTSLSDLVSKAHAMEETFRKEGNSKTRVVISALDKAATSLKPFEDLLRGICKGSPLAGDLIWASVSFVLEMATNSMRTYEQVLDFFITMGEELGYVKSLDSTFGDKPLVAPVIEALYVAIIDFWVKAVKHYRVKPTRVSRALSGTIDAAFSSGVSQKFELLKEEIANQKSRLQYVASAQHYSDTADHHLQSQKLLQTSRQTRLVTFISAPSYDADFRAADKKRHEGTCDWMLHKIEYRAWIDMNPFLVIYGIPGAGKTILSSWLIRQAQLRLHPHNQGFVLYHYFKDTDDSKRTPLAAMRSLVDQLYDQLRSSNMNDLLSTFENDLDARSVKSRVVFEDLWGFFSSSMLEISQFLKSIISVTIVLDAMDECKGSKPFVRELQKLVQNVHTIKVVITARKSGEHVDEFAHAPSKILQILEINRDDVKRDIVAFTQYKINKIPRLRGSAHETLRNNVIAELGKVDNHQGMFLWTYLMCKDVKRQLQISAIWKLLKHLPKGLDAVYARILKNLSDNENSTQRDFGRTVLQWIVGSGRPLRFTELEEALKTMNSTVTDTFFDDEEEYDSNYGGGLLWSRNDIVDACGDLVSYTGLDEGDTIGLIHLSTRHFLRSSPADIQIPIDLHPFKDSIAYFLVDTASAALTMSQTCLDYMLAKNMHLDPYFREHSKSDVVGHRPVNSRASLLSRYPLFEYAVFYWPEYVLDVLVAKSISLQAIKPLLNKVSVFVTDDFCLAWLEDYIGQTGTEFAFYTAQRLSSMSTSVYLPSDVLQWTSAILQMLDEFGQTVSRIPRMVNICWCQRRQTDISIKAETRRQKVLPFRSQVSSTEFEEKPEFPPLEKKIRSWLHYDHTNDRLFATDHTSDTIRLTCQTMKKGVRLRPTIDAEERSPCNQWVVRSAAISDRAGFIAVTFCPNNYGGIAAELFYRTVCWSIITNTDIRSTNEWAEVAFVDRVQGPECSIFRYPIGNYFSSEGSGSVVAFGTDNTLLTPGGIWNVLTEERIDGPESIWRPDPSLKASNTCFSGRGRRAARVNNKIQLEVLDVGSGSSILKRNFPEAERAIAGSGLLIGSFSHSGKKIIILYNECPLPNESSQVKQNNPSFLRRVCFVIDTQQSIELSMTYAARPQMSQFSRDEDTIVARLNSSTPAGEADDTDLEGSFSVYSFAVWSLVKDGEGRYSDHAQMIYLFKTFHSLPSFCLTPPKATGGTDVILANPDGTLIKRSIGMKWSEAEDLSLRASRSMLSHGGKTVGIIIRGNSLALLMCSDICGMRPIINFELWSLATREPSLISHFNRGLVESSRNDLIDLSLSVEEHYVAAKAHILHIVSEDEVVPLNLPFPIEEFISTTFNSNEDCFACVHKHGSCCYVSIFHVQGSNCTLRVSHTISEDTDLNSAPQEIKIVFHNSNPSLLAFSFWNYMFQNATWVLEISSDNQLTAIQLNDEYLPDLMFSLEGGYVYNVDRNVEKEEIKWPRLYPLTLTGLGPRMESTSVHPVEIREFNCYIHEPNMFRMRSDPRTGIVLLDHKFIDSISYRSRIICVKPDAFLRTTDSDLLLLWPLEEQDTNGPDELKLIILPAGEPVIINTGIRSEDVMKEDEWFEQE